MKKQNANSYSKAIEKILSKPSLQVKLIKKRINVQVIVKERKEAKNATTIKKQTFAKAQF
jgi:hypothetical protein